MALSLEKKLALLKEDFMDVTGQKFSHFHCPILNRDEQTELCKAHIINRAFPDADRSWTVQREDVDNFFGSVFESEFEKLQYRGRYTSTEILTDAKLAKKLRPRIRLEGEEIEHYVAGDNEVPSDFSGVEVVDADKKIRLGLKLHPDETLAALDQEWTIEVEQDIQIPALVSLLKAAHLTLFEMIGYEYALSGGGLFLGYEVLGKFFLKYAHLGKREALDEARSYFGEFVNLIRPMLSGPEDLTGTVTDRLLYLCMHSARPWAMMVIVRTGEYKHAVLVPILEHVESGVRFAEFLDASSQAIELKLARFAEDRWEVAPDTRFITWPEASLL